MIHPNKDFIKKHPFFARTFKKDLNTYTFVKFLPIFIGPGVGSAFIFGIHANFGWVLASEGPENT